MVAKLNFLSLDIDECIGGLHSCAETATCLNSDGSYKCECNAGYSGNGSTCNGYFNSFIHYVL